MRRLLPKSLHGQMLLAVALALLLAQVLAGVVIVRAERERAENRLIEALAFQLVADRPERGSVARRGPQRRDARLQRRLERALRNPQMVARWADAERQVSLRQLLESRAVPVGELVVLTRPIRPAEARNPPSSTSAPAQGGGLFEPGGMVVVAGLQRTGDTRWTTARAPLPVRGSGPFRAMLFQSLILYIVLVGGLALLLRRITRPLAALTARVEQFGGSAPQGDPLTPSGPADTRRLIEAHNAMEARIAGLLDEKDVMLGAIGHDLKTPLAALRVRIESVENEAERARMATTIEDITTSLDDILSLARVGRPSDPLERTDLSALVASVVEEYEDMGENVALGESARIALPLRATWMRRAIRNLIGNALRYGEQARIGLVREGDTVVIRIADKGPGIPDSEIAAMLEPFARGEGSRNRETGGAGLGLTLARAIAEQHGGTLTLANRIGEDGGVAGLVAELRLPR